MSSSSPGALDTAQALADETAHVRPDDLRPEDVSDWRPSALCLSGGGIRSAAFSLGVLQSLAQGRLLTQFDYLSTVSGGGFIGGWLQMVIRRRGGVAAAEEVLRSADAEEVRNLRGYTNYLTPQLGPLSLDTWAAVALYLRNLILNWLVILPVLFLIVITLIAHRTASAAFGRPDHPVFMWAILAAGSALLFSATVRACLLLPSHRRSGAEGPDYAVPQTIRRTVVAPTLAWVLSMPVVVHGMLPPPVPAWDQGYFGMEWQAGRHDWAWALVLPAAYAVAMLGAYGLAWWMQWREQDVRRLFSRNAAAWCTATLLAAAALFLAQRLYIIVDPDERAQVLTTFGPLALVICHLVQVVVHVGLRRECALAGLDREWLARVDALLLRFVVCWTLFSLGSLDLSWVFLGTAAPADATTWSVGVAAFLCGPAAAWIGKQVIARVAPGPGAAGKWQPSLRLVLNVLSVVFAVALFAVIGFCLQYLLGVVQIQLRIGRGNDPGSMGAFLQLLLVQAVFVVLLLLMRQAFGQVDVNRFSLHGVYRNRLSRAFLGSAFRAKDPEGRQADPFTGFGPNENPALQTFAARRARKEERMLFPVINMALNLTRHTPAAWAERKAASFTATPLACGSAELCPAGAGPGAGPGAYVPTAEYRSHAANPAQAGIGLGTVMTISGAAVSPNWGYNSSPVTAFLMTLFNVRLGAWMPNPAALERTEDGQVRLPGSPPAQDALLHELIGSATDDRASVYLSDGGHFDNLGLYEMLRRECALIVVVDAGADHSCGLFDLGNAIRKASIDGLGRVDLGPMRIMARTAIEQRRRTGPLALGVARGAITYKKGRTGQLLYPKPSYLHDIPAAVRAYGALHPEFPHESTAEQWFTESQFESYRALGAFQASALLKDAAGAPEGRMAALFGAADRLIATVPPPPRAALPPVPARVRWQRRMQPGK